jgi:hypothetical protein
MLYSEIKEVRELVDDEWRDAVESIAMKEEDFEVGNYRFICQDEIDKIQQDELSWEPYLLGCFTDWFLAGILNLEIDVIQELQKADAYEALGKMVLSMDKLEELQQEYVSCDGYGHHFSHYDGSEEELGNYYVFRVN